MNSQGKLKQGAQKLGIELNESQINQFLTYLSLLQKWNQQINLTALETREEIIEKHFLDSLALLASVSVRGEEKIIDVGTGGGFPGLPLKIVYPNLKLTLLEAVKKKATFLQQVVYKLGLETVEIIHGRAEDYGQHGQYREKYDYSLARAVAELNLLAEYCLPFVQLQGKFVAYKGPELETERKNSRQAVKILGGEAEIVDSYKLPFSKEKRQLFMVNKINSTPESYPRKTGKPAKQPL